MQRQHLQKLSREDLIREAERAGVPRPRVLTQAELVDEILKRTATSDRDRARARGWLGRARDLLATVVEKGLHLPDAAAAIRTGPKGWPPPPPPLPTVTLAEIYAAQGHLERAVSVLDDVLRREPDHDEARELRDRFLAQLGRGAAPAAEPPEPEAAPPETAPAATSPQGATPLVEASPAAEGPPVPPTMPAADTREGATAESAREAAPVVAVSHESAAAEASAPEDEALPPAAPPSVVTTSRSPSAWPPAGTAGTAPAGVRILVPGDGAPPAAASSSEAPVTPPPALSHDEALADTAPAEPTAAAVPAEPTAAEAEPAAAALPARYDVDEVVAIAVDPSTFYVYWEVRATTFAHMAAQAPGGSLALRVTAVTPGWEGPIVETRDIHIDALYGDRFVHHVRPRADVRVSVGWITEGRFDPIAVGSEVSAPRAFVAAGAPAPAAAPLDLSEGPHGSRPGGAITAGPTATALAAFARAPERLAAGWVPRDLHGVPIEGAQGGPQRAPAGWIWVPGARPELPVTFGPSAASPVRGAPEAVQGVDGERWSTAGEGTWWYSSSEDGEWRTWSEGGEWGGASEGGRWGGASEGGRWGGASEGGRWGGASEGGRWGGASEGGRWGGASERGVRWGGAGSTPAR